VNFTTAFSRQTDAPPILTRNSYQSTAGVDSKGLQISTTNLGDYRQGRAISQGQIFPSIPYYPTPAGQVFFQNIGNNTYQPENNAAATHAIITRLGDQQFKARENAPFADYMAEQRLAREVQDSERTAGLQELGLTREILRNVVAHRREQNESDYLRRALDSGMSAQDAQDELEGLRRNHALAEMKADDRTYQAKLLITRLAKARGVASMVQEPLDRSSAIHNPQPSEQMANAMGMVGEGFGQGKLDVAKQFLTPDYYRRMLKRTAMTSEAADRLTAMNQAFTDEATDEAGITQNTNTGKSFATLQGLERENELERHKDLVASRLEILRNRGNKIMGPLPKPIIGEELVSRLFGDKKKHERVRFEEVLIDTASPAELLVAANVVALKNPRAFRDELMRHGLHHEVASEYRRDLISILEKLTDAKKIAIPKPRFDAELKQTEIIKALRRYALASDTEVAGFQSAAEEYASFEAEGRPVSETIHAMAAARGYSQIRNIGANPVFSGAPAGVARTEPLMSSGGGGAGGVPVFHPGNQLAEPGVAGVQVNVLHQQTDADAGVAPLAGAGGGRAPRSRSGSPPRGATKVLSKMNTDELKEEARRRGLDASGTKKELQDRIREHKRK